MFYDEKERWAVCVHEAAHAVIVSLGGVDVYEIAVGSVASGECDGIRSRICLAMPARLPSGPASRWRRNIAIRTSPL